MEQRQCEREAGKLRNDKTRSTGRANPGKCVARRPRNRHGRVCERCRSREPIGASNVRRDGESRHRFAVRATPPYDRQQAKRRYDFGDPPPAGSRDRDDWHHAVCNVIYMQFLGLESARKAIEGLVEFEPTRAENIFTILLSELVAYGFPARAV
jgi:hypothetical protein